MSSRTGCARGHSSAHGDTRAWAWASGACVCKITENRSWRFRTVIHCSDYGRSCTASQEPGSAFSRDSPLLVAPRARQKWVGAAASLCPKSSSPSTARFVAVPNCFWSSL